MAKLDTLLSNTDFDVPPYDLQVNIKVNSFNDFCKDMQAESLRSLLGNAMYAELIDAELGDDSKWKKLVDGDNYTLNERSGLWVGFKALLKPYVHYRWLLDREEVSSGIGGVKGRPENADKKSMIRKIASSNLAYRVVVGLDYQCHYGIKYSTENSLVGYLNAKTEDFANWEFRAPKKINPLGI